MSQILVDEHLSRTEVLAPLRTWITARKIEDLAPDETLKDERILQLLRSQKQPTLVTLDAGFYHKRHCDRRYCLIYFALPHLERFSFACDPCPFVLSVAASAAESKNRLWSGLRLRSATLRPNGIASQGKLK